MLGGLNGSNGVSRKQKFYLETCVAQTAIPGVGRSKTLLLVNAEVQGGSGKADVEAPLSQVFD